MATLWQIADNSTAALDGRFLSRPRQRRPRQGDRLAARPDRDVEGAARLRSLLPAASAITLVETVERRASAAAIDRASLSLVGLHPHGKLAVAAANLHLIAHLHPTRPHDSAIDAEMAVQLCEMALCTRLSNGMPGSCASRRKRATHARLARRQASTSPIDSLCSEPILLDGHGTMHPSSITRLPLKPPRIDDRIGKDLLQRRYGSSWSKDGSATIHRAAPLLRCHHRRGTRREIRDRRKAPSRLRACPIHCF